MPCSAPPPEPIPCPGFSFDVPASVRAEVEQLDAELASVAAQAAHRLAVQPGGPGTEMRCPSCGHQDKFDGDALNESVTCTECGTAIVYGYPMPRWVNDPHADRRMLMMRVDAVVGGQRVHLELPVSRAFAHRLAIDLLAVCGPPGP